MLAQPSERIVIAPPADGAAEGTAAAPGATSAASAPTKAGAAREVTEGKLDSFVLARKFCAKLCLSVTTIILSKISQFPAVSLC